MKKVALCKSLSLFSPCFQELKEQEATGLLSRELYQDVISFGIDTARIIRMKEEKETMSTHWENINKYSN